MIEAERCRDDIDRGDHPARAIIPVARRAREAVAGQVEGDDAVIAAQPLGQRLPRLEAAVRSMEEQHHRYVARSLVALVIDLKSEARRVGKEGVWTCSPGWPAYP